MSRIAVIYVLAITTSGFSFGCANRAAPERAPSSIGAETPLATDYESERSAFKESARAFQQLRTNAIIRSVNVESDATLFIDSVFVPAKGHQKNLIILTAGVHGVETPAGGFQERWLMDHCLKNSAFDAKHTGLLIIDNANPYGFKNGRRANANNVDLNRNCFDYRLAPFPGTSLQNDYYLKYKTLLENPLGQMRLIVSGLSDAAGIRRALSGQYMSPAGIYYGGDRTQYECQTLQELMDPPVREATNVLHLDFHTGLGDFGVTQIMPNRAPPDEAALHSYQNEIQYLKMKLFPDSECKGVCQVQEPDQQAFEVTGDITQWLNDTYPEKRKRGVVITATSEIGTYNALTVLPAIVNENYCHAHPKECANPEATRDLKLAFAPDDAAWKARLEKAAEQTCRALSRFSDL